MKPLLSTLLFAAMASVLFADEAAPLPGPVTPEVRAKLKLDPFYQKIIDLGGMPVVGSAKVSDAALSEAAYLARKMVGHRPELFAAIGKAGVRFAIMAHDEYTTDIPEHASLTPRVYWDRRARGLGATAENPAVSAAEENLLSFPGDPYPREIIAIHEFAHTVHEVGMAAADPTFDARLQKVYKDAMAAGRWKGTYAAVDHKEFWAEASQDWFDNNAANDALHNDCNSREKLKAYEPAVAALCAEVYGDGPWRYQKPADRPAAGRAHLESVIKNKPRFQWRKEPVPERPQASCQWPGAEVTLEFAAENDRTALERFLLEAHGGYFSGGKVQQIAGGIVFVQAANTPDGAPVPAGVAPWKIVFSGERPAGALSAKVIEGKEAVEALPAPGAEPSRLQRVTRLN